MVEYIGDDVGDDDMSLLGLDAIGDDALSSILGGDAYIGGQRGRRRVPRALAVQQAAAQQGMATQVQPTNLAPQDLPIPATAFIANESRTITLQPQRTFRMDRPAFPSSIAPYFVMADLTINQISVFAAPGGVPCELYSEVAVGAKLYGQTVNQGAIIALQMTNIDGGAGHTLRGALKGVAMF